MSGLNPEQEKNLTAVLYWFVVVLKVFAMGMIVAIAHDLKELIFCGCPV